MENVSRVLSLHKYFLCINIFPISEGPVNIVIAASFVFCTACSQIHSFIRSFILIVNCEGESGCNRSSLLSCWCDCIVL